MWTALGVSPAHVEFLVEIRLRWGGSRLRVADDFIGSISWIEKNSAICLEFWKLSGWTCSRWVTLGVSSR
eukprot:5242463-Amphidinium_carterae.1